LTKIQELKKTHPTIDSFLNHDNMRRIRRLTAEGSHSSETVENACLLT